jgi:hypothetical protein
MDKGAIKQNASTAYSVKHGPLCGGKFNPNQGDGRYGREEPPEQGTIMREVCSADIKSVEPAKMIAIHRELGSQYRRNAFKLEKPVLFRQTSV